MMRFLTPLSLAALALAACSPSVPNDAQTGVGFGNYSDYQRQREAALINNAPAPVLAQNGTIQRAGLPAAPQVQVQAEDPSGAAANSGVAPVQASPSNPAPTQIANPGISDENDFDAVSSRESIESDAARIEQNRAQYQVIQPTALPSRQGDRPNIVAFAISAQNAKGQQVFRRSALRSANRTARNCAKYTSADLAQEDFLANGGPERDRLSLDPDGDGFACGWDPAPFRAALSN